MKKINFTLLFLLLTFNLFYASNLTRENEIKTNESITLSVDNYFEQDCSQEEEILTLYGESCIVQAVRNYHVMINSEVDIETAFEFSYNLLILCIMTGEHIKLD